MSVIYVFESILNKYVVNTAIYLKEYYLLGKCYRKIKDHLINRKVIEFVYSCKKYECYSTDSYIFLKAIFFLNFIAQVKKIWK